jgi:hypothetical protein
MKWMSLLPWFIVLTCISVVGFNWVGIGAHSKKYMERQNRATALVENNLQDCQKDTIQINRIKNGNIYFEKTIQKISATMNYIIISLLIVVVLTLVKTIGIITSDKSGKRRKS